MDPALKHRLIGAVVLSALAIIFLPMFLVSHDKNNAAADVPLSVPNAPGGDFQTRELPLVAPANGVPQGGVVGMDANHPSVPAAAASTGAAVDANGLPLPSGVQPASAASATTAPLAAKTNPPDASKPAASLPTTTAAPVVPATSVPIPAASAGGSYVVSLGTYASDINAQSLVASLKRAQLPAYGEPVTVAGKIQTRVRLGPFAQRSDAEAARLKAHQVRSDMPASVIALDEATPEPEAVAAPATKPAAASKAAPVSPASAAAVKPSASAIAHGFVVQINAFRSEDEALTLRNKLRTAGFVAYSEQIKTESGILYRVRVGPVADRDAADKLHGELSTKLGLGGIVMAYP